jgi:hypothetical protein
VYSKHKNRPVWFQLNYTFACSGLLSKVCVSCWSMHEFLCVIIIWNFIKSEIGGSHNSVAEDSGNLGCYTVLLHYDCFVFQRLYCPHLQGSSRPRRMLYRIIWGTVILRNFQNHSPYDKTLHHRRPGFIVNSFKLSS